MSLDQAKAFIAKMKSDVAFKERVLAIEDVAERFNFIFGTNKGLLRMAKKQKSINLSTSKELPDKAVECLEQKHLSTGVSALSPLSSPEEMLRLLHELEVHQRELAIEHEKLTRILRATTRCNEALIHSTDEMELLQKICNIVVDIGGYRMAWIGFAEHDKEKSVRPVVQAGFEEGYLNTMHITWDDIDRGRGTTGTAIRTGKPVTSFDIINDPQMKPWREEASDRGYVAVMSFPLKTDDEVFGVLSIYASHSNAFNAEETKFLTTLADNLAYGITALRTRLARQKVQDELSRSNDLMRFILQATNAGFWQHDLSTNTSTLSDEVWKLYGLKPNSNENPYDAWISTIIPEDREMVEQAVQEALKINGEYSCRWRVLNPDGTFRWFLSKGTPVKDSKGQIVRYAGLVLDITDQKKKEDALTESEQRFKTFFEKHSSVMLIIDPYTGSIIDANPAAVKFYGWSIEELRRMSMREINTIAPERFMAQIEEIRLSRNKHYSFQHRRADGSIRDVESFPNVIESGGKELVYSIIHDVTAQKVAEQKIRDYVKQLEGAMKSTLQAVAKVMEAHDPYTAGHDRRVGQIASDIAREMGWSEETHESFGNTTSVWTAVVTRRG